MVFGLTIIATLRLEESRWSEHFGFYKTIILSEDRDVGMIVTITEGDSRVYVTASNWRAGQAETVLDRITWQPPASPLAIVAKL
jgi:putative AlgH/UPF0301 family transcriptional regulator